MPSPIGHTLAGCAVALALIPPDTPQVWEAWALCLMSANLADLDFLPGLLVRKRIIAVQAIASSPLYSPPASGRLSWHGLPCPGVPEPASSCSPTRPMSASITVPPGVVFCWAGPSRNAGFKPRAPGFSG